MRTHSYANGEQVAAGKQDTDGNGSLGKRLQEIGRRVIADRQRAVAHLFDVADRYEALRGELSTSQLRTFLVDICGIAKGDVAGYAALLPALGEHREELIRHGVSTRVALKMATVRADVREEAIRMVRSGRNVQIAELSAVRRDLDLANLDAHGAFDAARPRALHAAAARKAKAASDGFLRDMEEFANDLALWLDEPAFNPFIEPYAARLAAQGAAASKLLARIGDLVDIEKFGSSNDAATWADAVTALEAIVAGDIADDPSWSLEEELHFEIAVRRRVLFDREIVASLARAFGFVVDPGGYRETRLAARSGRVPLTNLPQDGSKASPTVLELCAGGGGQAIGLHAAGFTHVGLIELKKAACATLRLNRPDWPVFEGDLRAVDYSSFADVDLLAGGVPCQPFSPAGKRKGKDDERDMFMEAINVVAKVRPKAIMLENVMGLFHSKHLPYRLAVLERLSKLGYDAEWCEMTAPDFGMAQNRRRMVLVGLRKGSMHRFRWPQAVDTRPSTVGETLHDLMAANGWKHADDWASKANGRCMTIIGGSELKRNTELSMPSGFAHWHSLAVNPRGIATAAPDADAGPVGAPGCDDAVGTYPRLTLRMVARLQGFPDDWRFTPPLTFAFNPDDNGMPERNPVPTYRQIANAFPPSMARALGVRIKRALTGRGIDATVPLPNSYRSSLPLMNRLALSGVGAS